MSVMLTLQTLAMHFQGLAQEVQKRRFAMGDTVNRMLELAPMSQVVEVLKRAVPNAKDSIGYAITPTTLGHLSVMASTFRDEGGLFSDDGKHVVTREDIEVLALTPAEASKLATLADKGDIRLKHIESAAEKVRNSSKGANGKSAKNSIAKVRTMLANGTDKRPSETSLEALIEQRKRLADRLAKLDAEIGKRRQQLAQAEADAKPAAATAPVRASKPAPARGTGKSQPQLSA